MEEDNKYDIETIDFLCDNLMQRGMQDGILLSEEIYDTLGSYDIDLAERFIKDAKEMDIKVIDNYKDNIGVAESNTLEDLNLFFKEINQYPLLTKEEEVALAKRKEEGDESARELLINSNMRLVINTALKYINKGVDLEDLISEGALGLVLACDKFDWSVGSKFDTLAYWYIRRNIRFAIAKYGKVVSLPVHLYNKLCNLKKNAYLFNQKNNRQPTVEEMSKITGEDIMTIKTLLEYNQEVVELDAEIQKSYGDNNSSPSEYRRVKDLIPEISDDTQRLYETIIRGMDILTEREREVLEARYGLESGNAIKTLDEVGKQFGLTRERIRQIESCAMRKLRHPNNLGGFATL